MSAQPGKNLHFALLRLEKHLRDHEILTEKDRDSTQSSSLEGKDHEGLPSRLGALRTSAATRTRGFLIAVILDHKTS